MENAFTKEVVASYAKFKDALDISYAGSNDILALATKSAETLYNFCDQLTDGQELTRSYFSVVCPDYIVLGEILNERTSVCLREKMTPEGHNKKYAQVEWADGSRRDFFEIITSVFNTCVFELLANELIQNPKEFYEGVGRPFASDLM